VVIKEMTSTVVNGMKGQPILLGVLVLNAIVIGALMYFLLEFGSVHDKRINLILERCLPVKPSKE
jgi:hypothetical protein